MSSGITIDFSFDLVHFNGPQTKFIFDRFYKHPVDAKTESISDQINYEKSKINQSVKVHGKA